MNFLMKPLLELPKCVTVIENQIEEVASGSSGPRNANSALSKPELSECRKPGS